MGTKKKNYKWWYSNKRLGKGSDYMIVAVLVIILILILIGVL